MTVQTAVQKIADVMADAEKRAWHNVKDARQLKDEFREIADGVPNAQLLSAKYSAELVAITSQTSAQLLDLHYRMTKDAIELGIDVPPAGGGEGEIGILSGGR